MLNHIAALLLALPAGSSDLDPADISRSWREAHGAEILTEFSEFLRLPNASADRGDIRRNAEWIQNSFRARGIELEIVEAAGAPAVVVGRFEVEGATRTLGLYAHFDGQPVDRKQWRFDPFEPTLCDRSVEAGGQPQPMPKPGEKIDGEWRLHGRSTGDDKAPFIAMLAAFDALRSANKGPTSNLVFLFDGEEEKGSTHLGAYMRQLGPKLEADLWLILDGPVHQSRKPQLVFGVRGIARVDITVYGAARYLHSGHYGNWAPNPGLRLSRLLAGMKDAQGKVLVEGFYDSVDPAGSDLAEALATIPPFEDALREEFQLSKSEADNAPYLERMLLPSLNIRGIQSATVGPTARNVIPPTASASLDLRLVKGNDPEAMGNLIVRHIERQGYYIVRADPTPEERLKHEKIARIDQKAGYRAVRTSMNLPVVRRLRSAVEDAIGGPPVLMPTMGGSLPLYLFEDLFRAPIVIVPIANHDNNQHAPNENLRLANLWYGIDLMACVLSM